MTGERLSAFACVLGTVLFSAGCTGEKGSAPKRYAVTSVIDGDTIDIDDGRRIRLLGIDTPERFTDPECYGDEAFNHLAQLLGDSKVELEYDIEREDSFGRTLAWVRTSELFVNAQMVDDGFACVLIIPPNGAEYEAFLESLESGAQSANRGLWGACGNCDVPALQAGALSR